MEWSTIVTIIFGSSLLGAILNNFVGLWLKRSDISRTSNYIALQLAYMFEGFSYACLSAVEDHDLAVDSRETSGKYLNRVPEFPPLPEFNYQVFDLSILDNVLDFPHQVRFANEAISFLFDVTDNDEAIKEAYKSSLTLASESLKIADKIRKQYNLTQRALKFGEYSVRERIAEKSKKLKKKLKMQSRLINQLNGLEDAFPKT